jgi:hypothetical protein
MTTKTKALAVATSLLMAGILSPIQPSNAALPSPFEIEMKAATKVSIGQAVPIAISDCQIVLKKKKYVTTCKYEKFIVTVNSFKFDKRTTPIDREVSVYAVDLKMENYSKKFDTGLEVGALLRCKNQKGFSSFYADGMDPQNIPAGSEVSGVVLASLPGDVSVEECQMPTLWITLSGYGVVLSDKSIVAEVKKKKLASRAYIPLTAEMLAAQ